jgi:signal peptidase I
MKWKELKGRIPVRKIEMRLRYVGNVLLVILLFLICAIILRVLLVDIYKIPSSSMEPTLLTGDIILVSKMSYGARLLNPILYFKQKEIEYLRTKSFSSIKKDDIFVFNWPSYKTTLDSKTIIYGDCLVKRCYALPGDSVLIKRGMKQFKKIGKIHSPIELFPHDITLTWSLDNYGPLYVPAKGGTIQLTKKNVIWYNEILLSENQHSIIKDSLFIKDGEALLQYTFKNNYYFMIGDNFYSSYDSRYWGFVPENNIIGKVVIVIFSVNPNKIGLKKIRWDRFFKTL